RTNQGDTLTTPILHKPITSMITITVGIKKPIPSATITLALLRVCSPLFSTAIEELPRIVSDGYHPPPLGKDGRHQGVDFAYYRQYGRSSIAGERVQAILEGYIVGLIEDRFPYGNAVIIETPYKRIPYHLAEGLGLQNGESLYTLYAHLSGYYPFVLGETVHACQVLGWVGKSGNTQVAHLHLETRIGKSGQIFSSMAYYTKEATDEERSLYLLWRTSGEFRHFDPLFLFSLKP
ncbi:MAG: M23 family metallopeptidase, partial [Anaerolineales bacterium]